LITIDKGVTEVASMKILNLDFILCEWHAFTAILRHIKFSKIFKIRIILLLKKIFGSKTDEELNNSVDKLKKFCIKIKKEKFYKYFMDEWSDYFKNILSN